MRMTRSITFNDLVEAYRLPFLELDRRAGALVQSLKGIGAVTGRDDAGIAIRGGSVFDSYLSEGWLVRELAAAYVWLKNLGCQQVLLDAIEIAKGKEEY